MLYSAPVVTHPYMKYYFSAWGLGPNTEEVPFKFVGSSKLCPNTNHMPVIDIGLSGKNWNGAKAGQCA